MSTERPTEPPMSPERPRNTPIVVRYKKRSFLHRLFLIDLLKGLSVTLREQFKPHTTVEYPKERLDLKPRFRGVPRLRNHPEHGEDLCIGCNQCAMACPDNCITVVAEARPEGAKIKAKGEGVHHRYSVLLCGLCVDPCRPSPSPRSTCRTISSSRILERSFRHAAAELYEGQTVEYKK